MFLQEKSLSLSVILSAGLRARLSTRCSCRAAPAQQHESRARAAQRVIQAEFSGGKNTLRCILYTLFTEPPQPPTAAHDWVRDKGMKT